MPEAGRKRIGARLFLIPALIAGLIGQAGAGDDETPLTIRHMPTDTSFDLRDAYVLELLALVLEQTEADYGPAALRAAPFRVSQSRAARLIRDGEYLDIIWAMTSRQREETLLPVRIPLMRGLMGARLLLVRREHVGRFAAVDNLRELREFALAQGHDWPDTPVLRANRLTVETSSDGDSLFRMLAHARVDAVPRAITEIWAEADSYRRHDLAVEPGLLLLYPAPNYFFVAPDREDLQRRLHEGLERAIADGSFQALFDRHPSIGQALQQHLTEDTRIIRLSNPDLPADTPLERSELWHAPLFGNDRRQSAAGEDSD